MCSSDAVEMQMVDIFRAEEGHYYRPTAVYGKRLRQSSLKLLGQGSATLCTASYASNFVGLK